MTKEEFTIHACEQALRFAQVDSWDDMSEELKVQLAFNMGAMSLGLNLSKEDGFLSLANVRKGTVSMTEFREHLKSVIDYYGVEVSKENIKKPF